MRKELNKAINSSTKSGHTNHAMLLLSVLRKWETGTYNDKEARIEAYKISLARAPINPTNNPKGGK